MKSIHWELMAKYFSSNISKEEEDQLFAWLRENSENEIIFKHARVFWESSIKEKDFDPDTDTAWEKLKSEILADNSGAKVVSMKPAKPVVKYLMIAASLLLIVGIGFLFTKNFAGTEEISATDHMEFFYLPDSSMIWLNKNSKLSYSSDFKNERTVHLEGEAFFDVHTDSLHPFIIKAENSSTKVMGTSFNLRAYKEDKDIQVVVVSGVVELSSKKEANKIVLVKDDKGTLGKKDNNLKKEKNTDPSILAWKSDKEEIKKTKQYQHEKTHSITYLLNDFNWRENLIKQTVVEGEIYNSAIFTTYTNVKLKVTYYDVDKKEQATSYFTVNEAVDPGVSIKYKHRLDDWFKETRSVKLEITDAEAIE